MFPNGYNMPFYTSYGIPNAAMNLGPSLGRSTGIASSINTLPRSGGLFSRLLGGGSGAARAGIGAAKSINWQGLLTNASKTLGVVNQAIPVIKQVGPMYNNIKSMLKVASLFKDETDPEHINTNNTHNKTNNNNEQKKEEKENTTINNNYSNSPNFFI